MPAEPGKIKNKYNMQESAIVRTGVVLTQKHPTDPSLYYVHFGEKTSESSGRIESGIWCTNSIQPFTRYRNTNDETISYGSYIPLQPFTPVNVLMSNGGLGSPTIIGFPSTNTSIPDNTHTSDLHVLGLTPKGSTIQMDDKTGAINIMYNKGMSAVHLSNDMISLELQNGSGGSSQEMNTSIALRKGAIHFKLPEATMQFDESGFGVSFNDGGTSVKITKKGVVMEGMELFKVASEEQVSIKGSKLTLQGTKDASLSANELKIGGKQLTNITGTQINIESVFATSMKSVALNFNATSKLDVRAAIKDETIAGASTKKAGIICEKSASHNIVTGSLNTSASIIAMDGLIQSNIGAGTAAAVPAYASSKVASLSLHAALTAFGLSLGVKSSSMMSLNKVWADTISGASEPAMEPVGNATGARDKNDKKSFGSVAGTYFTKNRETMHKYSVVPPLIAKSSHGSSLSSSYSNRGAINDSGTSSYLTSVVGYSDNTLGSVSKNNNSSSNSYPNLMYNKGNSNVV